MRRRSARRGRIWDKEEAQAVSLALYRFNTVSQAPRQLPSPQASIPSLSSPISLKTNAQPQIRRKQRAQAPHKRRQPCTTLSSRAQIQVGTEGIRTQATYNPPTPSLSSQNGLQPLAQPPKIKARTFCYPSTPSPSSFNSLDQPRTPRKARAPYAPPQLSGSSGSSLHGTAEPQIQLPTRRCIFRTKASHLFSALAACLLRRNAGSASLDLIGALNVRSLRSKSPLQLRDHLVQIFETPQLRAQALDLRHAEAAHFNELIHRCLSGLPENEPAQAPILRLLQDVCSESGELPSNYWLKRVTVNWRQCIGKGGEALIFVGCLHDRKVVARQIHKPDNKGWDTEAGQAALKYIRREIITHAQLRHPNVIAFLGVFRDDNNGGSPMVILPFMENGSAMDYLKQLSATELRISISSILLGITSALAYLHGKNPPICHGDVHPGNILIDAKGNAVLCDFGFSRIRHEITRTHTLIREGGRLRYLAPELSSGPCKFRTSQASDIYSLAMTFLTLLSLALPFAEIDREFEAARAAERGIRPKRPKKMNLMPAEENPVWEVLEHMWRHEPEKRADAFAVNEHLKGVFAYRSLWSTPSRSPI